MKSKLATLLMITSVMYNVAAFSYDELSPQNILIGATPDVQANANYGRGITVADLDTGIIPEWIGFQPQYTHMFLNNINTAASAVCLNNNCHAARVPLDGNGHGTFTASLITGGVPDFGMSGVAPGSNLMAVQVLDANGSGNTNDIANGIRYSVDHGAPILNLSLGPRGNASEQAGFYSALAGAINYAAAKNAVIIFAGGNEAQLLAGGYNISGLTDNAINHLLFTGSTDAGKQLSYFSNTPGQAGFISKTGKFYAYKNLWLMADGENIIGASNFYAPQSGFSYIALGSGTSFTAPQASGAAALLASRWPVLLLNATLPKLLEVTATDLGAAGADALYGRGFINLTAAMNPVGTLSVKSIQGNNVSLRSGTTLAGGALGSLSGLSSHLAHYTVFDSFSRDFTVNLSGLITQKTPQSALAQSVTAPQITAAKTNIGGGQSFAFASSENNLPITPIGSSGAKDKYWAMSFSDAKGSVIASGYGLPSSAAFGEALWGIASDTVQMPASFNSFSSLANGGNYFAYGTALSAKNRVAVSWATTGKSDMLTGNAVADSTSVSVGVSRDMTSYWKAGITVSSLNENNGLLGTASSSNSTLNLGSNNHSNAIAFSSLFALSDRTGILVDATIAKSDAAHYFDSILAGNSALYSRSFGIALTSRDILNKGDNAALSLAAPLRTYAGSLSLANSTVDSNGLAVVTAQKIGLKPNGNEMNLTMRYQAPVRKNMQVDFSLQGTKDMQNIAGENDVTALVSMKYGF